MKKTFLKAIAFSILLAPVFITGCTAITEFDEVTAERIARPAFMVERRLSANDMDFQLWERMHERHAPANIYIEGDGDNEAMFGTNPTPGNPVALHLASRDDSKNLIYIARPYQYKEAQDNNQCNSAYWTNRRFAPDVLAAYNDIMNEVKARYNITEFNIIGYDGGGNIAAILASVRNDIVSLRTVAGNLVPKLAYDSKREPLDADNLSAADIAPSLANMPQHHFIGAGDGATPIAVYHSFRQSMGNSECVHYSFVQDADHKRGWVEKWPQLLKATTACTIKPTPVPLPPHPMMVDEDASHGMK